MTLEEIGSRAKAVSRTLNNLGSREKNIGLEEAARALLEGEEEILAANQADYEKAESSGMSKGMLDRLALNPGRIQSMADGLFWAKFWFFGLAGGMDSAYTRGDLNQTYKQYK